MVVMPFFEKDLKAVYRSARRHGETSSLRCATSRATALFTATSSSDNVLLANVGTVEECDFRESNADSSIENDDSSVENADSSVENDNFW